MSGDVDFTRGGYGGDHFEESFKYFTAQHMEYWWQFREVLIASDRKKNVHCTYKNGDPLSDDDLREFIALSLTNYAVYVSITETLIFWNETRNYISGGHFFEARRTWKAAYSSLYSSFVAICNLSYSLTTKQFFLRSNRKGQTKNFNPGKAIDEICKVDKGLAAILSGCQKRLHIRHHLDHYWTIWLKTDERGYLLMDTNFDQKFDMGYVVLDPETEMTARTRIDVRTYSDLVQMAEDYDAIYKKFSLKGGYLDNFIESKDWLIKYADGKRPLTKADKP